MSDLIKGLRVRDVLAIAGMLIAGGSTFKGVQWAIAEKADRSEVQALDVRLRTVEPFAVRGVVVDSLLREILQEQREQRVEQRVQWNMICRQFATDSRCSRQ
jgi:hypothetical protein